MSGYYESERAAAEYLLFHYGARGLKPPPGWTLRGALQFPARCVSRCLVAARLPANARGLDLGCAVGAGSFELARHCGEVIGVDASRHFIAIANRLRRLGSVGFRSAEEGELTRPRRAVVPAGIDRRRVKFEVGDAARLRGDLGQFDVVMLANLIDRMVAPMKCLERLPALVRPGGQLILASPYTWLRDCTPRRHWLGGFHRDGRPVKTFETLKRALAPDFKLARQLDLPFLLREHARKYQLGISQAAVWFRR